jgi:hypothetical protein
MRNATLVGSVILGLALLAGCSKPPQEDIDAAKASLEQARTAGAQEYAADSFRAAEEAQANLETELKAQDDKFFKSYSRAGELARSAREAADKAAADAGSGRETAKTEVATMIENARTTLAETRTMVDKAPRGKGTAADIATLKADLDGVEAQLNEAQQLHDSESYMEARAKAEAATNTLTTVRNDVSGAQAQAAGSPQ